MKKKSIIFGAFFLLSSLVVTNFVIGDTGGSGKVPATLPNGKAYVNCGGWLNLRQKPSKNSSVLAKLYKNDEINITDRTGAWYKINSPRNGYVMAEFISGDQPEGEEDNSNLTEEEQVKIGRDMFMSAKNAELTNTP